MFDPGTEHPQRKHIERNVPQPGVDEYSLEYLLRALGATETAAMDFSDYEGAEFIQDLNQPIPAEWKSRFDFIFDGGTLARTAWAGFLEAAQEMADEGTFSRFAQLPNVDAVFRDR